VVFICPFLSCFILSTENLHHILATIAVAARHFLHRAERHFRDNRSVQNDDLDEVRDLQLPFCSRVLNQRTAIRCLCHVIGAASRFLRRLRRAVAEAAAAGGSQFPWRLQRAVIQAKHVCSRVIMAQLWSGL
jgi:hypothetical protein